MAGTASRELSSEEYRKRAVKMNHALIFGVCSVAQLVFFIITLIPKVEVPASLVLLVTINLAIFELGYWIFFCYQVETFQKRVNGPKKPRFFYVRHNLLGRFLIWAPFSLLAVTFWSVGADACWRNCRAFLIMWFALCALLDCSSVVYVSVIDFGKVIGKGDAHELEQVQV